LLNKCENCQQKKTSRPIYQRHIQVGVGFIVRCQLSLVIFKLSLLSCLPVEALNFTRVIYLNRLFAAATVCT
jgi:hypothetical protein